MPSVNEEEMERRNQVAAVLRGFLQEKNMKPSQLAKLAGTPASAVFSLLNTTNGLGPRLAEKLISAGIDENSLLEAVGFKATSDNQGKAVSRIARKLQKLASRDQQVIEEVVDGLLRRNRDEG